MDLLNERRHKKKNLRFKYLLLIKLDFKIKHSQIINLLLVNNFILSLQRT